MWLAEQLTVDVLTTRVGIYGWRKYLVYILILLLSCLAVRAACNALIWLYAELFM